jgi:2-amino-4-hydroxy-6-hydroxymethyldihydropteridine diphosphokinase
MTRVYVGAGSNIDPEKNIPAAVSLLSKSVLITGISMFYRTRPIGRPQQSFYYNGVLRCETEFDPAELKAGVLLPIETGLGRQRSSDRFTPRTIDLDILLYGCSVIHDRDLKIPDPDILTRSFLAIPLCELDPDLILPQWELPVREAAERFRSEPMDALIDFTETVKSVIGFSAS